MSFPNRLITVLSSPTADGLWQFRGDLLEAGLASDSRTCTVLAAFHSFLDQLSRRTSSRQYSHLASLLDVGGVGGVLVQDLLEAKTPRDLGQRLLGAVFSEGLMVAATRQHVKAWEQEMASVYGGAVWKLYDEIWRMSRELKPEVSPLQRRELIDRLFEPLITAGTSGTLKAVIIGRLFQLVLLHNLIRDWEKREGKSETS